MSQTLFAQGRQAFQEKNYQTALEALGQIVTQNPDHEEAWRMLGLTYLDLGNAHEAVKAQEHTVRIDPKEAQNYTNLGRALEVSGQQQRARETYERALRLDPLQSDATTGLKRLTQPQPAYLEQNPPMRQLGQVGQSMASLGQSSTPNADQESHSAPQTQSVS
jgi:tetratricopeptide (TPR) repeat protein